MRTNRIRCLLIIGLVIILSACVGNNAALPPTSPPTLSSINQEEPQADVETDPLSTDTETEPEANGEGETESASINAADLFANNCASCHGADRSGARGPSLLPERLTKEASHYAETITNGSGPMPSFGSRLSAEEINALAEWILLPPE